MFINSGDMLTWVSGVMKSAYINNERDKQKEKDNEHKRKLQERFLNDNSFDADETDFDYITTHMTKKEYLEEKEMYKLINGEENRGNRKPRESTGYCKKSR